MAACGGFLDLCVQPLVVVALVRLLAFSGLPHPLHHPEGRSLLRWLLHQRGHVRIQGRVDLLDRELFLSTWLWQVWSTCLVGWLDRTLRSSRVLAAIVLCVWELVPDSCALPGRVAH